MFGDTRDGIGRLPPRRRDRPARSLYARMRQAIYPSIDAAAGAPHVGASGAEGDKGGGSTYYVQRAGWGRSSVLIAGVALVLLAVLALLIVLGVTQRTVGPRQATGPPGAPGAPGTLVLDGNGTNGSLNSLTVGAGGFLAFEPDNASLSYDAARECLVAQPALCTERLEIDGELVLGPQTTVTGTLSFNPLHIGNTTLEETPEGALAIDGPLELPLTLAHAGLPGPPLTTLSSEAPAGGLPGDPPLLCIEAPGGLCLKNTRIELENGTIVTGQFDAVDRPRFSGGLLLGAEPPLPGPEESSYAGPADGGPLPAGGPLADEADLLVRARGDLYTCAAPVAEGLPPGATDPLAFGPDTPEARLGVGCDGAAGGGDARQPVRLGEVQDVLLLAPDACLAWGNSSGQPGAERNAPLCYDTGSGCATWEAPCLVLNSTNVSFVNGAKVASGLQVDGPVQLGDDLTVAGDFFIGGALGFSSLNVTGNLSLGDSLFVPTIATNDLTVMTSLTLEPFADLIIGAGGTLTSDAAAFFNNAATFNSNLLVSGSGTLSMQSGSDFVLGSSATFQAGSGASASCGSPIFGPASGCTPTCPALETCDVVAGSLSVPNGDIDFARSTGALFPGGVDLQMGEPFEPAGSHTLHAGALLRTGATYEGVHAQERRAQVRDRIDVVGTPNPGFAVCDTTDGSGTNCELVEERYNFEGTEALGGQHLTYALEVLRTCDKLNPTTTFAFCEPEFRTTPSFPTSTLLNSSAGSVVVPDPPFPDEDEVELVDAAYLDLRGTDGAARLFGSRTVDIGDIGDATSGWTAAGAKPPGDPTVITMHGDVVVQGELSVLGAGGSITLTDAFGSYETATATDGEVLRFTAAAALSPQSLGGAAGSFPDSFTYTFAAAANSGLYAISASLELDDATALAAGAFAGIYFEVPHLGRIAPGACTKSDSELQVLEAVAGRALVACETALYLDSPGGQTVRAVAVYRTPGGTGGGTFGVAQFSPDTRFEISFLP